MVQPFLAVFLVFALLCAAIWMLRRKGLPTMRALTGRAASAKQLRIIDKLSLTPQHSLHLIGVADTVLLIGVSPSSCYSIANLSAPATVTLEPAAQKAAGLAP